MRLFSVLVGLWVANFTAFDGDALRRASDTVPGVGRKARSAIPLITGSRLMVSLCRQPGTLSRAGRIWIAHWRITILAYIVRWRCNWPKIPA